MKTADFKDKIIETLQKQIIEKDLIITKKELLLTEKDTRIEMLEYRLLLALRQRYAARRERLDPESRQGDLFDEAVIEAPAELSEPVVEESTPVAAYTRKKTGRKALPKDLPRVRREYDLNDADKTCACGCLMQAIGFDTSEQLEIIPAQMFVISHVKKKYACKSCEETVKTAKAPKQAIPKSMAGSGLLAHVLVCKFVDHLPLYRQEQILQRVGIDIGRATLGNWVIKCGQLLAPLVKLMQDEINQYDIAYSDETVLQVLKEPNRTAEQKSYMWLFGGGAPKHFCWVYQYHPSRAGTIPANFFADFNGFIHTDGYAGYSALTENKQIELVGCLAHARRKFFDVTKATKKSTGLAGAALKMIGKLYDIERKAKQKILSHPEINTLRQQEALPILTIFKQWLDEHSQKVPPKSPIGQAIQYTLNQWEKLSTYIKDPRLDIDNNRTERSIKPFVIGRKNWLFADQVEGANAAAIIYSLIETCKVHDIEPYAYLRYVLTHLPQMTTLEQIETLLPYNCKQQPLDVHYKLSSD